MKNYSAEEIERVIRKVLTETDEITQIDYKNRYYEYVKDSRPSSVIITRGKNKGRILEQSYTRNVLYTLNKFIKHTGNILIKDITLSIAEKFVISSFSKSKYAAALDFRILRAAFNKAVDWGFIVTNPFNKVKLPKIQKNPPQYITREQLEIILEFIPEKLKDVFRFAFLTGIRLGELTNLIWKNINVKEQIIQIGDESFNTKSRKIRTIPICNEAAKILSDRVPKIFDRNKSVFCKTNKIRFTNDYLSKAFKKALRKTDLDESIHFHTLRHSFASKLVKDGASIYHLSKLLGHSSVSVTEIYSHLNVESLRATVNKFNSVASN